jgi:phosphonate transport system substrate-binding protein
MKMRNIVTMLIAFVLVLAACSDSDSEPEASSTTAAPTTTAATEAPGPEVGSPDNPIKVLFVPSVSAEEILAGGEILQGILEEATGLSYEVSVPTSYAATINEICASPDNTVGFIPATAYVLGNDLCGIDVALKSERFGFTEYWAEFIVPRESTATSLADLAGLKWAYPDAGSTSGFLVPSGMFGQNGIEPGEQLEAGGHSASVRAVYTGEADFATVFFSPSIDGDKTVLWDGTTTNADVPDDKVEACALDGNGEIDCDGVFPRDARRNIREEAPDVIQKLRILELSQPIPNDTVSFGPDVSDDIRTQIVSALVAFAANDPEGFDIAFDAYSWQGVVDTADSEFDFIRALVQNLGLGPDDL